MWLPPRLRRWRWHASFNSAIAARPTLLIVSGGSAAIVSAVRRLTAPVAHPASPAAML